MKATKTLNAVVAASLFAGASLAQAASYDVTGTLDGFSSSPSVISAIFNPESPVFTGVWDVDTTSLTGTAAFGAYSVGWSLLDTPVGTTNYLNDAYQLSSTSASYDAGSRTLTVLGTVVNTSATYNCQGAAFFCGGALPTFDLALSLTFTDASLQSFSGNLTATNDDGFGSAYTYSWSFNGAAPEVPVPAAAWLFGTGLVALAGLARNRSR